MKNILFGFMKSILILVSNIKKYKLTKMIKNTYCLELIFILPKYCLAVEIDEKGHTDRDLKFEEKRQEALEKTLNCTFIRINTSRENFDADYEASEIQAFISQFKDNEIKERDKELEHEIEKLKLQLTNLGIKNNDVNDRKQIVQSYYKKCIFIVKSAVNIQLIHLQKN